jgi:hypothetical protein
MKEPKQPRKLSRAQIQQGLDTLPVSSILGRNAASELTPRQRKFALEVAKGNSKVDAYRSAYNAKSKHTLSRAPYILSRDERIKQEVEAIRLAIETEEHRTPAALRALVIQSLVGVITHPDSKPGQITAAAKVLGTVTEVAAFTERKEVRTITSSADARETLMAQIRELTKATAQDADIIEAQAASLLAELSPAEPHHTPTPQTDEKESQAYAHTIPHEQSAIPHEQNPPETVYPSTEEHPPVGDQN